MIPVVTTCDERYWPGLVALHNSFLRNSSEGFEFWAILDGSDEFAQRAVDRGIRVIHNLHFPLKTVPTSFRYPEPFPMSYKRLLVPDLFESDRSIYIDTDSLILKSLKGLSDIRFNAPVAATRSNSPSHKEWGNPGQVKGLQGSEYGPMSSLYIFNRKAWLRQKIMAKCLAAMKRADIEFYTLSQGLLNFVLGDNWHELPWEYQPHAGHNTYFSHPRKAYSLHFMGTNPWDELRPEFVTDNKLKTRELWQSYA